MLIIDIVLLFDIARFQNLNDAIIGLCFFDVRVDSRRKTVKNIWFLLTTGLSSLQSSCKVEVKSSTVCNQKLNMLAASGCSGSICSSPRAK